MNEFLKVDFAPRNKEIIFAIILLAVGGAIALAVNALLLVSYPKPPVQFDGPPRILVDNPLCPESTLRWEYRLIINEPGMACLSRSVFDLDTKQTIRTTSLAEPICFNWPASSLGKPQVIRPETKVDFPPGNYALVDTVFKLNGSQDFYELYFQVAPCPSEP